VDGTLRLQARILDVAGNPHGPSGTLVLRTVSAPGDTNVDGKADLDSFGVASSKFTFTVPDGATTSSAPFAAAPGDIPFQADWDADGKIDFGFYRPSSGEYYVQFSRGSSVHFAFGLPGDVPVPADYDGDLVTDFATYRPSTGAWTIFRSQTGVLDTVYLGQPGDVPVPADYDGDHFTDYAIYRPSTAQFFVAPSSGKTSGFNNAFTPNAISPIPNSGLGLPNISVPIVSDYDGDGKADIAVYQFTTGDWYTWRSSSTPTAFRYGIPGLDVPVPADYDGDGRTDYALFRPSTVEWQILGTAGMARIIASGNVNDIPLMAPLPYRTGALTATSSRSTPGGFGSDFEEAPIAAAAPAPGSSAAAGSTVATTAGAGGEALTNAAPAAKAPASAVAVPVRRRPAQGQGARANGHHAAKANHPHDAALEHLGRFKLIRRRRHNDA
jgi:hypothetical protein